MRESIYVMMCGILLLIADICSAQNLLNQPESVVFDASRHRYLVSNWANGHLVQIDSMGNQSYFVTNQNCHAGLIIIENVIYVACRYAGVKGFDLTTGVNVLDVSISASNINDITADNAGNLYLSYPAAGKIYKVNIANQTPSLFVESGLSVPNGLCFDERYNRLLVCSYRSNSPIQAVDLVDSSLSIVTSTFLDNLDGITMDKDGNVYVSSWADNAVYKFDSAFANQPIQFSSHPDDPADIFFDSVNSVLAVPLFYTNQVEFVPVSASQVSDRLENIPEDLTLYPNYPNPFNPVTTISFSLPNPSLVNLNVFDITGRHIATLINGMRDQGIHRITFGGTDLSSGVYFCQLKSESTTAVRTMILLK